MERQLGNAFNSKLYGAIGCRCRSRLHLYVSNSSTPIGLETAYGLIQKADYWINVGVASTLDELKAVNPKFADAKAVREKTVYNNNLRLTPTGGNDYWESAGVRPDVVLRDLIHIFHPELVTDSLYYYRHLE